MDGAGPGGAAGGGDGREPDGGRGAGAFHRLPPVVVLAALAVAGVEAAFQLGAAGFAGGAEAIGWRQAAMARFGFSAPLFERMLVRQPAAPGDLLRLVSYGAVHLGAVHAAFAAALLLALGKAVSDAFGQAATAAAMAAGLVAGALAYGVAQGGAALLVGAYPAVYGLLGAFTWSLWAKAEGRGRWLAFRLVAVLLALQLALGLAFGGGRGWVAEAGGFAAGFALAFVLAPDAGARLRRWRERLRG